MKEAHYFLRFRNDKAISLVKLANDRYFYIAGNDLTPDKEIWIADNPCHPHVSLVIEYLTKKYPRALRDFTKTAQGDVKQARKGGMSIGALLTLTAPNPR